MKQFVIVGQVFGEMTTTQPLYAADALDSINFNHQDERDFVNRWMLYAGRGHLYRGKRWVVFCVKGRQTPMHKRTWPLQEANS